MSRRKNDFMTLLEDYFETYLPYSRGLSQNTIKSYKQSFLLLLRFMLDVKKTNAEDIKFSALTYDTLLEFFGWIETDRQCKASTRNQRLSALSAFSEYAQNRDFDAAFVFRSAIIKIPVKKRKNKPRSVFSREEIKILLDLPDETYETGLRDKVLLSFMYATGARAQETCDFTVADLRINNRTASVTLVGKGSKTRQVGISLSLAKIVQNYIKHRHIDRHPDRHVFSSQTHEQMTVSCIEEIFKKYIKEAKELHPDLFKMESYSPHSMRHTTATHMIEMGIPLVVIKNFLGHSSITTTEVYIEIAQNTIDKNVREWNEKWFGPSAKANKKNDKDSILSFLK